jgi:hypothetical protein
MDQPQYVRCIEACDACATTCDQCAATCLREVDAQALVHCIALIVACGYFCQRASAAVGLGEEHSSPICEWCADVCETCAEECGRRQTEHCKACAQACYRCAAECRRMVGQAGSKTGCRALRPVH